MSMLACPSVLHRIRAAAHEFVRADSTAFARYLKGNGYVSLSKNKRRLK
jgi:hypothetical protein